MTAIVLQRPKNNSDNSVALNRLLKRVFKKQMLQNTAVGKRNIFSKYVPVKKGVLRTWPRRGSGGERGDQWTISEGPLKQCERYKEGAERQRVDTFIALLAWCDLSPLPKRQNDRTARVGEGAIIIILSGLKESAASHTHTHTQCPKCWHTDDWTADQWKDNQW